jgi:uncharacterized protein YidB (DUF937 family)
MRKSMTMFAGATALVAGLAAAPALYADESQKPREHGAMMGSGMMGQGDMSGMMSMMGQMAGMMEGCTKMMQGASNGGSGEPNDQWRKEAPTTPDKNG